jgi:hypothetical protein
MMTALGLKSHDANDYIRLIVLKIHNLGHERNVIRMRKVKKSAICSAIVHTGSNATQEVAIDADVGRRQFSLLRSVADKVLSCVSTVKTGSIN